MVVSVAGGEGSGGREWAAEVGVGVGVVVAAEEARGSGEDGLSGEDWDDGLGEEGTWRGHWDVGELYALEERRLGRASISSGRPVIYRPKFIQDGLFSHSIVTHHTNTFRQNVEQSLEESLARPRMFLSGSFGIEQTTNDIWEGAPPWCKLRRQAPLLDRSLFPKKP